MLVVGNAQVMHTIDQGSFLLIRCIGVEEPHAIVAAVVVVAPIIAVAAIR